MTDDALDPALKAMLKAAAEAPAGPSIRDLPVPEARAAYRERYLIRGIRAPEAPVAMTEHVLELPDRVIDARLYRPARAGDTPALPLVIYFHGGGFVVGDPAAYDNQSRWLADRLGALVLTPDYRLAPEHPFPAAVDDAIAAWAALPGAAARFGIDPERLAIGGDSAGGNLSAVVALAARDDGMHLPRLQWLVYPATDLAHRHPSRDDFAEGYLLDDATITWFLDQYLPDRTAAVDWRASPLRATDHRGLPPALIVTAGCDPLADEGQAYAEALSRAGVAVEHRVYPGMLHGFINTAGALDQARDAVARSIDALKAALRG